MGLAYFDGNPSPPALFIVCIVMWTIHGFILDIGVIGLLPMMNPKASDAQRADKFPWALGGYDGYPKVDNLAPTHRRFIAENAAYALLRIAPIFFLRNEAVLLMAVVSYFIEGLTIQWEINKYSAPGNSMVPQTLMAVFATIVTVTVSINTDDYIVPQNDEVKLVTQIFCGLTWACWIMGAKGAMANKSKGGTAPAPVAVAVEAA